MPKISYLSDNDNQLNYYSNNDNFNGWNYLDNNYDYDKEKPKKYIEDFTTMSQCDIIISSPSTYCISAGFIGKEKKIIHSKEWLDYRVEEDDKFWVDLYNGGNEDYKLWKMV